MDGPVLTSGTHALQLNEWETAGPDSHGEIMGGLSLGDDRASRALARKLAEEGVVEVTELRHGLQVTTKSFVGRIRVGPLDISILPKLAWQRWLGLFSYALRLRGLVRTEQVAVRISPTSLQDLIILELLVEARDLIGRGLHRDYVRHRKRLTAPRGRIDFGRIARAGGLREATVPCRFTRRSDDHALNRALLAGLHTAAVLATDAQLQGSVRGLARQLGESVLAVALTQEAIAAARKKMDRRTGRYAPALRLIELLAHGRTVSVQTPERASTVDLPGFALDMNMLWQRLLGRVLREWAPDDAVTGEFALRGLVAPDPRYSPKRRAMHIPRPDFAVLRRQRPWVYLDAKYRDIWEKGLPRHMLYQIALYAAAVEARMATILYPSEHPEAMEERLLIRDPHDGAVRATVALRPVSLGRLEELIGAAPGERRARERRVFARGLIG